MGSLERTLRRRQRREGVAAAARPERIDKDAVAVAGQKRAAWLPTMLRALNLRFSKHAGQRRTQ